MPRTVNDLPQCVDLIHADPPSGNNRKLRRGAAGIDVKGSLGAAVCVAVGGNASFLLLTQIRIANSRQRGQSQLRRGSHLGNLGSKRALLAAMTYREFQKT